VTKPEGSRKSLQGIKEENVKNRLIMLLMVFTMLCAALPSQGADGKPAAAPSHNVGMKLPRLVDLGAKECIPCKMMGPVLEKLGKDYKGKLKVEFIDVWENRAAAKEYKIRAIPTQIFYEAGGREFYRHEGFISSEDILAKFKEHGIVFKK
jgi:thioredoxin 1